MKRTTTDESVPVEVLGSYSRALCELRPDAIDVMFLHNEGIDDVRDTALAAEDSGALPRMDYGRLVRP